MCDQAWQIGNAQAALRDAAKANPAEDGYRYFPLPIVFDETIKDQYLDPVSFVKNRGWGITVKCKDPERVIEFVDHLLKEETQILVKWGVEGETYLRDKNGRMYRTQEMIDKMDQKFNDEYGFTMFGWDWPHWGTSSTLSDGNAAVPGRQPEIFELSLTEADKKFFKAYGIRTYADLFTPPDPRPWYPAWGIPRGPEQQLFEQQKADIQRKYIPKLVLSKPEDFDKVWEEYTAALNKLDIAGYERWFTQQIKEIVGKASAK
jgi:putative aldouronate transport system substrate-binding protein